MNSQQQLDILHRRLDSLERQNSRFRIGACGIFSVLFVSVLVGFAAREVPGAVQANDFQLVDPQGNIRARLHINERGPLLGFWDSSNRHCVTLGLRDEKPFFVMADGGKKTRLAAGCTEERTWLELFDAKQQLLWQAPTDSAK